MLIYEKNERRSREIYIIIIIIIIALIIIQMAAWSNSQTKRIRFLIIVINHIHTSEINSGLVLRHSLELIRSKF